MRDRDKFVHDNEFRSNKACTGGVACAVNERGSARRRESVCECFLSLSLSLMHLTLCDKVNVMQDEFTGRVRALVTCATL